MTEITIRSNNIDKNSVTVAAVSLFSGKINEMVLPMNEHAFRAAWMHWKGTDCFVQDAFPSFNEDEREFLISGMTPEEWGDCFPIEA